jgi:predicted nucleotidyltransferase
MADLNSILGQVKATVKAVDAKATLILYGSYARGEQHKDSDIDLLILVDKDRLTRADQKRMKYPLYELEFETGTIISPLVLSLKDWETLHRKTPFYENVTREGRIL